MLAQLFRSTARLLNVRVENTNGSSYALEDEETFVSFSTILPNDVVFKRGIIIIIY